MTEYNDRANIIRESARIKTPYDVTLAQLKEYIEDNNFLKHCFKTHLMGYRDIFVECFINKKSIRDYAKEKNMNRGSVEHLRKKLIAQFAAMLEARDKSNGRNRLLEKKKRQSEWIDFDF